MNKFIVPEQDIDRLAIEEAVRNDAWLVLPNEIDVRIIISKAKDMGLEDRLNFCSWEDVCSCGKTVELSEYKVVFAYTDHILQEMIKKGHCRAISMFMESDVK